MPETYHLGVAFAPHHTTPIPRSASPFVNRQHCHRKRDGGLWRPPWNVENDVDFNHQWWRTGISWKARDKPPKWSLKWTMDVGLSERGLSPIFFMAFLLGKIMVDHQILGVERVDQRWIGWRDHLQETTPYLVVEIRVSYMLSFPEIDF